MKPYEGSAAAFSNPLPTFIYLRFCWRRHRLALSAFAVRQRVLPRVQRERRSAGQGVKRFSYASWRAFTTRRSRPILMSCLWRKRTPTQALP